ncbi:MAG: ribosome-associated translation inhibitor RaiA [Alphaproteobacteria bacterium]|nr:ribosome-associated translation inhibitor RaiA [Alphaproteobacteria bacterium]
MERPLEIVFHNLSPSTEIEKLVREHVARLEKFYPRMIGCRVAVEIPHKQHKTGNVPEVHVEMQVPGQTLVVRHEHHARERHASPNVRTSLKDAFSAAREKLRDFKQRQAGG